ncbi:MAG TPA: succinate dehydrogenase cytochrome b558 subunit [Pirellulales bacterium]|nr:succinate dehydrogenase cytochrome b558 subunit [Pirellulales bacterium]
MSGLIPVGAYMVVHLLTNASVLGGPDVFQRQVDTIHSLGPALPLVEWTFIFLPILFHAAVGVVIVRSGLSNASSYALVGNFRYLLQRATAWIALFFIFYHVFQMHGWIHAGWWTRAIHNYGAQFNPDLATSSTVRALASVPVRIAYLVGILSCVFHLANGLWTMGITWGVWTTPAAQRKANWLCGAFGVILAVVGVGALVGISSTDEVTALASEQVALERRLADLERIKQGGGTGVDDKIHEVKQSLATVQARQSELGKARPTAGQASLEK